jgi:hypothetical protein
MSTLRHRFRYVLDGESHDVMTNARDIAAVQGMVDEGSEDASAGMGAMMTYAVLHACALRLDIPGTPGDLNKFIDLLDELDDLDGIPAGVSGDALPDPTQLTD